MILKVVRDTVMSGDTFGGILSNHGVSQAKIYEVATTFREVFDVRKIGSRAPLCTAKIKGFSESDTGVCLRKKQNRIRRD